MNRRLLVVDDDPTIRFAVSTYFKARGFVISEASDCHSTELILENETPDLIILDYRLPDGTALDLLRKWQDSDWPRPPIILLTGHGSIDLAVRAIKSGADNFVTKPVELETLALMVERALENQQNRRVRLLRKSREERQEPNPFVGRSRPIRDLERDARKVLKSKLPILIQGETGTGKGVLANWLHRHSDRADESFVDINCAGLSRDFLESELFGHIKGAFTGASQSKVGLLEIAHRGTVFLDEIGDLALEVQPKLLKVLEDQRFRRLGDVRDLPVDLWLIAATHQDLSQGVRDGSFRSDLYFRLSTIPLQVPPLRQRPEDISLLAELLLKEMANQLGHGRLTLSAAAHRALAEYSWPGNVRELRNVLERAVLLAEGDVLAVEDLRFQHELGPTPEAGPIATLEELEIQHIRAILKHEQGQVARAAERLGIPRSTLYQKLKRYRIEPGEV